MLTSNTLTQTTLAPKAQLFTLALAALVSPATTAFSAADVGTDYITGAGALMVSIGDAGNAPDPANDVNGTKFGGVPYGYSIGKYAVTNAQYAKFLNAVNPTGVDTYSLYNASMGSAAHGGITKIDDTSDGAHYVVKGIAENGMSYADMPVNYVSFWDAARFCNWLTNGGGTASGGDPAAIAASSAALTEKGVYTLGRTATPTNSDVTRNVAVDGSTLTGTGDLAQTNGTVWAVSSEDEWYKAAYYNGAAGTYRTYPTTKDGDTAPTQTTEANYFDRQYAFGSPYLAEVDYYDGVEVADSYYGTFQQGGNVWEWNDTIIGTGSQYRGMRGGSFPYGILYLASSLRTYAAPGYENDGYAGFRVSSLLITSVPEPGTYGILGGAAALLGTIALRRRNRRD